MGKTLRSLLRAVPASQRVINVVGYEARADSEAALAQTAYLGALGEATSSDEVVRASRAVRAIFTDGSGSFFTVHDSEDGPVTLPASMPPTFDHHSAEASRGGFISQQDAAEMRGDLMRLYLADAGVYPAAARATASHPGLVAQAASSLLKSAMSEGLTDLTTGLAGQENVLDGMKKMFPSGGAGDLLSSANLGAGAGMLTGQIAAMAFGALNDALFGGIDDNSSTGAQLGAFAGKEMMGKVEGAATAELTAAIQGAIDPASVAPPSPEDAKSTSQEIKEFFNGVSSNATMPAARLNDPTAHGGKIVKGAAKTLFNGLAAARALDVQACPMVTATVPHVGGPIREGNPTILVEAMLAARAGHMVICTGVGMQNPIVAGSGNILLGPKSATVIPPPTPKSPPNSSDSAGSKGKSQGDGPKGDGSSGDKADEQNRKEGTKAAPSKEGGEETTNKQTPKEEPKRDPAKGEGSGSSKEKPLDFDKESGASAGIAKASDKLGEEQQAASDAADKNKAAAKADADAKTSSANDMTREAEALEQEAKSARTLADQTGKLSEGKMADMAETIKDNVAANNAELEAAAKRGAATTMTAEARASQEVAQSLPKGTGVGPLGKGVGVAAKVLGPALDLYEGAGAIQSATTNREIVQAGTGTFFGIVGGDAGCGVGAAVGAAIASPTGPGAIIGAGVGCVGGAIIGSQVAKDAGRIIGGVATDVAEWCYDW
jgi:uncharacterized Zn-binding protein involved in type VI secretion